MALKSMITSGAVSVVVIALQAAFQLYEWGFRLNIEWNPKIWLYALSAILALLSFFFAVGSELEPEIEQRELENEAKNMGNTQVGSRQTQSTVKTKFKSPPRVARNRKKKKFSDAVYSSL
jgi:high-affinity Fe2+/Pb2+ permease